MGYKAETMVPIGNRAQAHLDQTQWCGSPISKGYGVVIMEHEVGSWSREKGPYASNPPRMRVLF